MNNKMFALAIVALMMMSASIPLVCTTEDTEATANDDIDYEGFYAAIEALGDNPTEEQITAVAEAYGIEPITAALITIVVLSMIEGFLIGELAHMLLDNNDTPETPAGSQDQVNRFAQEYLSKLIDRGLTIVSNMTTGLMPNDASMIKYTSNYFQRTIEYAVYAQWEVGKTMKVENLMDISEIRDKLTKYIYQWQAVVNNNLNVSFLEQLNFTSDTYADMAMSIDYSGGSLKTLAPSSDGYTYADLASIVMFSGTQGQDVYLKVASGSETSIGNKQMPRANYLYSSITATLTNLDDSSKTFNVTPGYTVVPSNMPSGVYRITSTSSGILAGNIAKAYTDNAIQNIYGGMVITNGNDYKFVLPSGSSGNVQVYSDPNTSTTSSYINVTTQYKDQEGTNKTMTNSLLDMVLNYDRMIKAVTEVYDDCASSATAVWQIFDTCQSSNQYVNPSLIATAVVGTSMSSVEKTIAYYNAMESFVEYWNHNKDALKTSDVTISEVDMDVLVYGSISYNGKVIVENAIFTPYNFMYSESLKKDETVTWSQPGHAIVWLENASSIGQSIGNTTSLGSLKFVPLNAGYQIDVKGLKMNNQIVDEIELSIPEVNITPDPIDPGTVPETPKVISAASLMDIIFIELAIILILIGVITGHPMAFGIAGALIAGIGIFFSNDIANAVVNNNIVGALLPFLVIGLIAAIVVILIKRFV